jgi:hypothetical protein
MLMNVNLSQDRAAVNGQSRKYRRFGTSHKQAAHIVAAFATDVPWLK